MATGKINKTSRPSNKKVQTGPITTSKKPLASELPPEQLKAIDRLVSGADSIPWNLPTREWSPAHRKLIQDMAGDGVEGKGLNFHALDKECRKAVRRDVLLSITSDYTSTCPSPKDCPGDDDFLVGNHFAWGASQVNTDLAQAAHCESEEDIYLEDGTFFDFLASSEYQKLKQTFMEEAEKDEEDAVLNLVWRAYNAGTYSPERRHPDSREVREERQQHREKAKATRKADKARATADKALADAHELARELGYKSQRSDDLIH